MLTGCHTAARPLKPAALVPADQDRGSVAGAIAAEAGHQATVVVKSLPEGAVVVVDGYPVGPTPCSITLPVNDGGYLQRDVSVKVRFLSADASTRSTTKTLLLTPVDRAPARLDFTPTETRRIVGTRDG